METHRVANGHGYFGGSKKWTCILQSLKKLSVLCKKICQPETSGVE